MCPKTRCRNHVQISVYPTSSWADQRRGARGCGGLPYHRLSVSHLSPQRPLRMAKLTISDAARACRVARSTLQRAINAGRLSLDAEHRIDTAELMRAGYTLHAAL